MKTASTSGLKLRLMLGSLSDALEAIAVFTGLALAGDDGRELDLDDASLANMIFVQTSGPTGKVIVGVSESLAQAWVVGAGNDPEDADASWRYVSDLCLDSARAFVASMSAGGALVGPVDRATPLEGLGDLAQTHRLDGVVTNVTSSDETTGSVVWIIPEPEAAEPAEVAQPVEYPELGKGVGSAPASPISFLSDVALEVTVELGRTTMRLKEVLELSEGSVVELDRQVGAYVDVLVNGSLVAAGEVVVIDDVLGVRITSVHDVEGGIV